MKNIFKTKLAKYIAGTTLVIGGGALAYAGYKEGKSVSEVVEAIGETVKESIEEVVETISEEV